MSPTVAIRWVMPTIATASLTLGTFSQAVKASAIGIAVITSMAFGCGGYYLSATNIPWIGGETIQAFAARKEAVKQGMY